MASEEQVLQEAKQLIQQRHYEQARKLLRQLPKNETAQKWLVKLEALAPPSAQELTTRQIMMLLVVVSLLVVGAFAIGGMAGYTLKEDTIITATVMPTVTEQWPTWTPSPRP